MFYYQSSYNANWNPISRIDTQSKFYDQTFLNGLSKSYIDVQKPAFKEFSLRPSYNNYQQESIQSSPIQQIPSDFESRLQQAVQKSDQFQFDIVQYCNLTIPNNEDQIAVNSINYYLNCINVNQDITKKNLIEQLQQYVNLIQYLIILIQQQQSAKIAEFGQQQDCLKKEFENQLQQSNRSIYEDSIQTLRETRNVQDNNFLNRLPNSFQIETQEEQNMQSSFNTTSQNESQNESRQIQSSQRLESSFNSEYQRQAEQLEADLQDFIEQKSQKK